MFGNGVYGRRVKARTVTVTVSLAIAPVVVCDREPQGDCLLCRYCGRGVIGGVFSAVISERANVGLAVHSRCAIVPSGSLEVALSVTVAPPSTVIFPVSTVTVGVWFAASARTVISDGIGVGVLTIANCERDGDGLGKRHTRRHCEHGTGAGIGAQSTVTGRPRKSEAAIFIIRVRSRSVDGDLRAAVNGHVASGDRGYGRGVGCGDIN